MCAWLKTAVWRTEQHAYCACHVHSSRSAVTSVTHTVPMSNELDFLVCGTPLRPFSSPGWWNKHEHHHYHHLRHRILYICTDCILSLYWPDCSLWAVCQIIMFYSTLTGRICCFHPMLGRRWWASPLSTPLFLNDWLSSRQAPLVHAWFFTWTEGWGFGRGHGLLWSGLGSREVETRLRVENRIWLLRVRVFYKMCRLSRLTCRTHTLVGRRGRCPSGPRGLCLSSCFVSLCSSPMSLPASSGETKRQHSESVVRKNETKHSVNEWTSSSNTQFAHIL